MSEKGIDLAWQRVYGFSSVDHVRFNHAPHIRAKVECATCHGNVGEQTVAQRSVDHTMGFCSELPQRAQGRARSTVRPVTSSDGSPLLHQAHRHYRHERNARQLRQSRRSPVRFVPADDIVPAGSRRGSVRLPGAGLTGPTRHGCRCRGRSRRPRASATRGLPRRKNWKARRIIPSITAGCALAARPLVTYHPVTQPLGAPGTAARGAMTRCHGKTR